jgi:hypothetical protein
MKCIGEKSLRVRVKFAKYGPMKFIGHLELMRYLQGAVRRTDIPVKYDEGMHQRMVMSFAMPLGLLCSGALAEQIGVEKWFLLCGIGIIIVGVLVFTLPILRNFDCQSNKE